MNTIKKYIAFILMFLFTGLINGQDFKKFPGIKMLLMETQLAEIKRNIIIDNDNIPKFDQIYREYIKEMSELNAGNPGPAILDSNLDKLSEQEVEDNFIRQTDKSKRLLILREKYFYEFKSVMRPRDIIQMYRIEREIMRKVQQEIKNRGI